MNTKVFMTAASCVCGLASCLVSCKGNATAQPAESKTDSVAYEQAKCDPVPKEGGPASEYCDTATIVRTIREFYINTQKTWGEPHDSICREAMTPQMLEHLHRYAEEHDAGLLIQGQDVPDGFEETLNVRYSGGGWFRVSFSDLGKTYVVAVLVKCVKDAEGHYKIAYVYPLGGEPSANHEKLVRERADSAFRKGATPPLNP